MDWTADGADGIKVDGSSGRENAIFTYCLLLWEDRDEGDSGVGAPFDLRGGVGSASRGNERGDIVRDNADRQRWIQWLARTVEIYGWLVHAFVLLTNHFHLFVETPVANLSKGMQYLNGSYTGYFNTRHRRVGHLYQGRFKGLVIQTEGHYLVISRYVHLNPLRANAAPHPEVWPWSSCPGYHWSRRTLPWWFTRGRREFDRDEVKPRKTYRRFMSAGLGSDLDSPLKEAIHGLIFGTEKFVAKVQRLIEKHQADPAIPTLWQLRGRPYVAQLVTGVCEHYGMDDTGWKEGDRSDDVGRAITAYLCRRRYGYSVKQVVGTLGYRGNSGAYNAVRRIESSLDRQGRALRQIEARLENH